ncbi:type II-A CRISPR-associated protein Csn2, partial [Phascolarctobacterium succinatutens]
MKLVYTELEQQLVFQENKVNVLVIEQKELFRRMIQELDKQISGEECGFVLSDNNKTIKIDKEICLILNPFALD